MIGANGPKMLRLTARYADQWNTWLAMSQSAADAFPADNAPVDAACLEVGRDPATLERTASIMVDMNGRREIPASMGPNRAQPLTGTPDEIADEIRAFAALGVSHLQLYLIPNTVATLRTFEPVLRALGRA
jgi:alkanesulfonate monooxygenase SsuD/methylene tetrahydromethanopterin reductase-like flavin-dependent oxidoreductase (luciferase family)